MAAEKLMELGCGKLLFLGVGPKILGEADKRGPGFENACRQAGAHYDQLFLRDEESEEKLYAFLQEHLRSGALDHDGIFCNTDGLAIRVMAFLRENGVRIPEDV